MWKTGIFVILLGFGVDSRSLDPVSPGTGTIPSTEFRCQAQQYPGIYADTQTDCQVFHFCEGRGTNASFLCPEQTRFNQQYFVCDWWYNVDCGRATEFYALNRDLYITPDALYISPDTLQRLPAHSPQAQPQTTAQLKSSGSSLSHTLSSDVSQLDSSSSSNHLGTSQPSGYRRGPTTPAPIPATPAPSIISVSGKGNAPEGYSATGSPSTPAFGTSPTYTAPTSSYPAPSSSPAAYQAASGLDDAADPEPYNFVPTNAVTDPQPYSIDPNSDSADPEPYGYGPTYDSADPEPQGYGPNYDSADPEPAAYYDSADPEPAAFYTGSLDLSAVSSDQSSYSSGYYSDSADPEPDQYTVNLLGSKWSQGSPRSSGSKLFSTASTLTNFYSDLPSNGFVVDSADPEPDPEFTPYN